MNITINIQGLEPLVEALNHLAQALGGGNGLHPLSQVNTQAPMPQGQNSPVNNIPPTPPVNAQAPVSSSQFPANGTPAASINPAQAGRAMPGGVPNGQLPTNGAPTAPTLAGAPTGQFPVNGVPVNLPMPGGTQSAQQPAPGQASPAIPTTALPASYTQDQLAVAMTGLVDQGKQPQVMQVLAQFGAQSLMQVPKEQYPALAMHLRQLGANL